MEYACLGVAVALQTLLEHYSRPGRVPQVFDERLYPLCGPNSPLGVVSFVWSENHPLLGKPRGCMSFDYALCVVSRLEMTHKELVLAYAIVEQLINTQPSAVQAHSLRPIFLIASVVATKVTLDEPHSIAASFMKLRDVFTTTSVPLLVVMERQLLVLLQWHLPTGNIHQDCACPLACPRCFPRLADAPRPNLTPRSPLS